MLNETRLMHECHYAFEWLNPVVKEQEKSRRLTLLHSYRYKRLLYYYIPSSLSNDLTKIALNRSIIVEPSIPVSVSQSLMIPVLPNIIQMVDASGS